MVVPVVSVYLDLSGLEASFVDLAYEAHRLIGQVVMPEDVDVPHQSTYRDSFRVRRARLSQRAVA